MYICFRYYCEVIWCQYYPYLFFLLFLYISHYSRIHIPILSLNTCYFQTFRMWVKAPDSLITVQLCVVLFLYHILIFSRPWIAGPDNEREVSADVNRRYSAGGGGVLWTGRILVRVLRLEQHAENQPTQISQVQERRHPDCLWVPFIWALFWKGWLRWKFNSMPLNINHHMCCDVKQIPLKTSSFMCTYYSL